MKNVTRDYGASTGAARTLLARTGDVYSVLAQYLEDRLSVLDLQSHG